MNPEAYYKAGIVLKDAKKEDEAKIYFEKSARYNYKEAEYELGRIYEKEKNSKMAYQYYKKAFEHGHLEAFRDCITQEINDKEECFFIGMQYHRGVKTSLSTKPVIPKDPFEAFQWFKRASPLP